MRKYLLAITFLTILLSAQALAVTESVSLDDYVLDFEYDEDNVEAGETFRLEVTITNEAGETREDIEISLDLEDPFDNVGDDEKTIGTLEDEESRTVSFRLEVDNDAEEDEYAIDFDIKDNKGDDSDDFVIDVKSNIPELIIGDISSSPTIIAPDTEDIRLTLTVENIGEGDAKFVRARIILPQGFSSSNSFSDRANLGTITNTFSKQATFFIDTAEIVNSGRNKGVLRLEFEDEDNDNHIENIEFDLPIKGRPQFIITGSSTIPSKLSPGSEGNIKVTIQNIGEEEGQETSIRVFENSDQPFEFNEKTNFIGTLKPKESGSGTLSFDIDSDAVPKSYLLRTEIRTVNEGNVIVDEQTLRIEIEEREASNPTIYLLGGTGFLALILIFFLYRASRH